MLGLELVDVHHSIAQSVQLPQQARIKLGAIGNSGVANHFAAIRTASQMDFQHRIE